MKRPVKSDRDKIAAKARRMFADPLKAAEARAAWNRVVDKLASLRMNNDQSETAREAMLRGLVAGKTIEECEALALQSVAQE